MKQLDLLDPRRLSRRTDPSSSHRAARRVVASGQRLTHARRCLEALRAEPYWTPASILARKVGLQPYEVRKRLPELEREGLVTRTEIEGAREQYWRIR